MIIRIVKMTFKPATAALFLKIFHESRETISKMPGCLHLELWQDADHPNGYVTYSHWESTEALNAYRESEFFKKVWAETKVLFSNKPLAFSVVRMAGSN